MEFDYVIEGIFVARYKGTSLDDVLVRFNVSSFSLSDSDQRAWWHQDGQYHELFVVEDSHTLEH